MQTIELLAPARDSEAARAAILCGADAVYLGAPQFSARQAAGNSLEAIAEAVALARPFDVQVYIAFNTLLYDAELPQAEAMIHDLYAIGIDGLIIQDVGLLELDLPPLPLIASTQMHNNTPEKVKFLEQVGFSRAILARELTLEQIRNIRRHTTIELECFVHGALCVSQSGRCAMSYALGGRSGNRGRCAQPCRRRYTLKDANGTVRCKDRYLLSLKDLDLSARLEELIDAGICSFKIEGRLKEAPYVANTVGYYRQRLDDLVRQKGLKKSAAGEVTLHFTPNLDKTFNRGFTEYGLIEPDRQMGAIDTPKSIGEFVGTVQQTNSQSFVLDGDIELHNADGVCFFDARKNLQGTLINRVDGRRIYPQSMNGIQKGVPLYRNSDCQFLKVFQGRFANRKISVKMTLRETQTGIKLLGKDENGNQAAFEIDIDKQPARQTETAVRRTSEQLAKLGNTLFTCTEVNIETENVYFIPISTLNALKRGLIEKLTRLRQTKRPKPRNQINQNSVPYPHKELLWYDNVLNKKAEAFYRRHGVEHIQPAAESGLDLHGQTVMSTKYCLRRQLGLCRKDAEPLFLEDQDGREFRVRFLCGLCGMELDWEK